MKLSRRNSFVAAAGVAGTLLLAALPAFADEIYAGDTSGNFVQYDTLTGNYTLLGNNSTVIYGFAYDTSGSLYANDNAVGPVTGFYSVNTSNGALTSIANLGNSNGAAVIASTTSGGTTYAVTTGSPNDLFTVDLSTGNLTAVGPLGPGVGGEWDLNYGPDGNLYLSTEGSLYLVNTTTGAASLVGSFGVGDMQSIIAADGNLYGFDGNQMYSINLTNGAATFIRDTPSALGNFDAEISAFSSGTTAPEPGAILLMGTGLVALGAAIRRRSR